MSSPRSRERIASMTSIARGIVIALGALFVTACHSGTTNQAGAPLALVSPLPAPTVPSLVTEIHPTGTVGRRAQIRIRFRNDLIPLEALETPREAEILAAFTIEPALPGRFRFLTPRMIGFQADGTLPASSRVQVRIAHGFADRTGAKLDRDLTWTFQTDAIAISDLPMQKDRGEPDPGPLLPSVSFSSNVALDVGSLVEHAALVPDSGGSPVALVTPPASATPTPDATPKNDLEDATFSYKLVPASPLAKGTTYAIAIAAGVLPARGNLASLSAFRGRLRTFAPLRFTGEMNDTSGPTRFDSGVPTLVFSNPIDPKSIAAAVHLEPAPRAGTLVGSPGDATSLALNPALLEPNTDYTLTIGSSLADTFGQTLGHEERVQIRTADRSPDIWAPTGTHVFPSTADVRLNVSAVNIARGDAHARFVKLAPKDVVAHEDPTGEESSLLASAPWPDFPLSGVANVERTIAVPLAQQLGGSSGVLAYGVRAKIGMASDGHGGSTPVRKSFGGLVQLTNLGVFAEYFAESGFVRVDRIAGGTPVSGATVEVFRSQVDDKNRSATAQPCASGRTGDDGIARFAGSSFRACAALDAGTNQAPALVTIVRDGGDWTYVRTDNYTGTFASGIDNGWSSTTPISRATIFSDRSLYQPGEDVKLTAVGWFLRGGHLARGVAASYTVELRRPDDTILTLPRLTLNAYGTGSISVSLPKPALLGYYTVHASAGNGEDFSGSFRVAEFKPPNFKVALALDSTTAVAGSSIKASTVSTYLFGSPVQAATTAYHVTRSIANYTWPKDDSFTFGRQWFWPEQQPSIPTDVKNETVATDPTGLAVTSVPVAADLPYPMTYRVDADTTDVANLTVGGTASFTAFPGPTSIGLKTSDIAAAGKPTTIAVVAVDVHGTIVPNTKVHLDLQLAKISNATQVVEGSDTQEQSITYSSVAGTDVDTAATAVNAQLTAPAAGFYRIRATIAGATSDAMETDAQLYVTGPGQQLWGQQDPNQIALHLDKTTYHLGDTARAIVQSPFPDADILVAVVRNGVIWNKRMRSHDSAPSVSFQITSDMLPNAAFEAVVVRRGALPKIDSVDGGHALARSGFAAFEVATDRKKLRVKAQATNATLRPAGKQTVRIHLTDLAGASVRGQVTLIVANDAILQLSGYRPPDLVQLVYAHQPISARFADNRENVVLHAMAPMMAEKGWGYGGGLAAGAEDTRIRHNFQPLAYYAPAILTDVHGDASVSFVVPDDLTTWRVMAVAATTDGRFGNGESTFLTNKALIANPVVPQFARVGDRFDAGVAIANPLALTDGTLSIAGELTAPLAFLENGAQRASTTFETPIDRLTKAYRFSMEANGVGTSTATFRASVNAKSQSAHDGFAIPVDVIDRAVMEQVITTGVTTSATAIPVLVSAETPVDSGGLDLIFANSLLPEAVLVVRKSLDDAPQLAFLAASRVAVIADVMRLRAQTKATGAEPATQVRIDKRVRADLAFLRTQQRADGGFGSYPGASTSDPFDSIDVLGAYSRAQAAGLPVDSTSFARARTFAATVLADPSRFLWCKNDPCKSLVRLRALDALADAGDRRTTFLGSIDAVRDRFDFADRIRLARYLVLAPGYAARGAEEAATIRGRLYETGALATMNVSQRYAWASAPEVAQALATRLLVTQHADAVTIDKLTRSLLAVRRNGSWGCTCEDAVVLDALLDISTAAGPPPNLNVSAKLHGKLVASKQFTGNRATMVSSTVSPANLPVGESTLALTSMGGALHYAATYRYRLVGEQPGRLAGLRITRIVRDAGGKAPLATMGLAQLAAPVTLDAARVFDIELQIVTDHAVDRVTITDPLPAGMEAVDTTFATSTQSTSFGESWQIDNQQIFHDRVEAYADSLGPGVFTMHYLVRSVTTGTFRWPGAEAHLAANAEEFGRSASATLVVK